ncbi:unnamed protein product [Eretmochelys imbricata]
MSREKADDLSRTLKDHHIDIMAHQETHMKEEDKAVRHKIYGYTKIAAVNHPKHGLAEYMQNGLEDVEVLEEFLTSRREINMVRFRDIIIVNIYKPPNIVWPDPIFPSVPQLAIYIGDFNSHHEDWGYCSNETAGRQITEWASLEDLHLLYDLKQSGSFWSGRWTMDRNSDLCFVTRNSAGVPLATTRTILSHFLHSQHCPVILQIALEVPLLQSVPKPRWSFHKADWPAYTSETESLIPWLEPIPRNFGHFTNILKSSAKKYIPRGHHKTFTPCWTKESEPLLREYEKNGNPDKATALLESLKSVHLERWKETVESLDFTHSSRKAWALLWQLGVIPTSNTMLSKGDSKCCCLSSSF